MDLTEQASVPNIAPPYKIFQCQVFSAEWEVGVVFADTYALDMEKKTVTQIWIWFNTVHCCNKVQTCCEDDVFGVNLYLIALRNKLFNNPILLKENVLEKYVCVVYVLDLKAPRVLFWLFHLSFKTIIGFYMTARDFFVLIQGHLMLINHPPKTNMTKVEMANVPFFSFKPGFVRFRSPLIVF